MSDTLEYSDAVFPQHRFDQALLNELNETCANSVSEEGEHVIVKHIYIERRITPLNIAAKNASDKELDRLMKGHGDTIKDLAAAILRVPA
jgi:isocitrate dehydrogenase kinase/phosphatase